MGRPDPTRIIDMASAYWQSCTLFAASDLGLFAALAEEPGLTAEKLAAKINLDERGTRLLADACVAVGLLSKSGDAYENTPDTAMFLVPGSPGDLSKAIRYNRDVYSAWGKLPEFVKSGEPVEAPSLHLGDDKERTRAFVLSMHGRCLGIGRAVIPMLDLADAETLLDIGGGPGTYSVLAAQAREGLRCTVMDLPGIVDVAEELVRDQGMAERVRFIRGSYRETDFPEGQDVVLFFGMMHQESVDSIRGLLTRAHACLNPGGRVYVMDMMTDATHTAPAFSALFATNMALTTESGWVFSDEEITGWMHEAGFIDTSVTPLPPPMPHWLAVGRKEG